MSLAILSAIAITAAFVSCTSLGAKGVSRTLLPEGVDKAVVSISGTPVLRDVGTSCVSNRMEAGLGAQADAFGFRLAL